MSIRLPDSCPRNRKDCEPLGQILSDDGSTFICCGVNDPASRQLIQNKFRHCYKSDDFDEMQDLEPREIIDIISVLSQALSADANDEASFLDG